MSFLCGWGKVILVCVTLNKSEITIAATTARTGRCPTPDSTHRNHPECQKQTEETAQHGQNEKIEINSKVKLVF